VPRGKASLSSEIAFVARTGAGPSLRSNQEMLMNTIGYGDQDIGRGVIAVALLALCAVPSLAMGDDDEEDSSELVAWRAMIARTPPPAGGCAEAAYPATSWTTVACLEAPLKIYPGLEGTGINAPVGAGSDYVAYGGGSLLTSSEGSFPSVTGVRSEDDSGVSNAYTIQVIPNTVTIQYCVYEPYADEVCEYRERFIYSSVDQKAVIQYGLRISGLDFPGCPAGWTHLPFTIDCYKNSSAVQVPEFPITRLHALRLKASATSDGDTLTFMNRSHAYAVSERGSILWNHWTESEFNVFGMCGSFLLNGCGQAIFNAGSAVTVKVDVNDAASEAYCALNSGTTQGSGNNLTLGTCKSTGGSHPHITFTESN
jgi:hypothetical protein